MAMKKKSKKTKKYLQAGGDLRLPGWDRARAEDDVPGGMAVAGSNPGQSATGQVKAISTAADRARDYLSTAGKALGENQPSGFGGLYPDLRSAAVRNYKGGKVKKSAKKAVSGKARGVGRAVQKKVRPAKMIKMKGS
jgi:hypothetical protein